MDITWSKDRLVVSSGIDLSSLTDIVIVHIFGVDHMASYTFVNKFIVSGSFFQLWDVDSYFLEIGFVV